MIFPDLYGSCDQTSFYIYTACDTQYFDEFAPALVNSIKANTMLPVHLHVFNPTPAQIAFCQQPGVSMTWEYVSLDMFNPAARHWNGVAASDERLRRTMNAMSKGGDVSLQERLQKTYYACARFVRLAELFNRDIGAFAIDVDAIVRKDITSLTEHDFYVHRIDGDKARFMAGGFYLNANENSSRFINEYSAAIQQYFARDEIYWGIDQDVLDPIVPKYPWGRLPASYIDWYMRDNSYVWTAKGTRKNLESFIAAQKQYSS